MSAGISYPITSETRRVLASHPSIFSAFRLPNSNQSSHEIVALLNSHYQHSKELLNFLEETLPIAGTTGRRSILAKCPFAFAQANAELFLFAHLHKEITKVNSSICRNDLKCPDLECEFDGATVKIEVYSPVGFPGFQLFERLIPRVLKNLPVDRGFYLEAETYAVHKKQDGVEDKYYYPYDFPGEKETRAWLNDFGKETTQWLSQTSPERFLCMLGPDKTVNMIVELLEVQ